MKWIDFTITKLTIPLVLGIITSYYCNITILEVILLFAISFTILCCLYVKAKQQLFQKTWFGIAMLFGFFSLGMLTEITHQELHFQHHYSNDIDDFDKTKTIQIKIRQVLRSSTYYDKYIGILQYCDSSKVSGKLLLNIKKDSSSTKLQVDDILVTKTKMVPINTSLNPSTFNYKNYLAKQYIFHQIYLDSLTFSVTKNTSQSIYGKAAQLRNHIKVALQKYNFTKDEFAIIDALFLGQRQELSETIRTQYTKAGAIHILAISGLHIGILLWMLNVILKPLERFHYGNGIKLMLIVSILWCFAIVAGLSASVVRAVTMFSILTIGMHLKRQTYTLHILTVSLFLIVLCKPHFIFDVGFQLSYIAVFAIVWWQPLVLKLWNPKNWFIKYFWSLVSVSLCAQLGVLPLSLYYFHQFPSLFIISNLTIIPILGILLGLGVLILCFSVFISIPEICIIIFKKLLWYMNFCIAWVASKEDFVFTEVSLSGYEMLSLYTLFVTLGLYIQYKKKYFLKTIVFSCIVVQGCFFFTKYRIANQHELTVFHLTKQSMITEVFQGQQMIYNTTDSLSSYQNKLLQQQRISNNVSTSITKKMQNAYTLEDKNFLIVDSLGIYKIPNYPSAYILLQYSPKINLNRLIAMHQPKVIIADGSNYKSYEKRWKETCIKQKIPFHNTREKGAFVIRFNNRN